MQKPQFFRDDAGVPRNFFDGTNAVRGNVVCTNDHTAGIANRLADAVIREIRSKEVDRLNEWSKWVLGEGGDKKELETDIIQALITVLEGRVENA